jgi:ketopantoate reductase
MKEYRIAIDFLGGKVVAYAREAGISVPFFTTMTNLVKALESSYSDNAKK